MYTAPKPEVFTEFKHPSAQELEKMEEEYGIGALDPIVWKDKPWSEGFDQNHPSRTKFRLERGSMAPLPEDLAKAVSIWHTDIMPGVIGRAAPTSTLIASYPSIPRIIAGVVPGLPSIDTEEGIWNLARLTGESYIGNFLLHELTEKALEAGNAHVLELDNGLVYLMPKGQIHARTDDLGLRIVGQGHPDIPYDPLWLSFHPEIKESLQLC